MTEHQQWEEIFRREHRALKRQAKQNLALFIALILGILGGAGSIAYNAGTWNQKIEHMENTKATTQGLIETQNMINTIKIQNINKLDSLNLWFRKYIELNSLEHANIVKDIEFLKDHGVYRGGGGNSSK